MKMKFFYNLIYLVLVSSTYFVQATEAKDFEIQAYSLKSFSGSAIGDKVYLYPGMAHIVPSGLVVQINGELIHVSSIESDAYGVFILIQETAGKVKPGDWCCTTCWNWNPNYRTTCVWCGADREDWD